MTSVNCQEKMDTILQKLRGVRKEGKGYKAICPAHADKGPSLSISTDAKGEKILLHCFAGCEAEKICGAIGIEVNDLFCDERPPKDHANKYLEAFWRHGINPDKIMDIIQDINHPTIFLAPNENGGYKKYLAWRQEAQKFAWNCPKLPDGVPGYKVYGEFYDLKKYREPNYKNDLYIFEGDWDWFKGIECGLNATSPLTGAGCIPKDSKTLEIFKPFETIVICYDNDNAGKKGAKALSELLKKNFAEKTIATLELPFLLNEKGKDFCDYMLKHSLEEFLSLPRTVVSDTEIIKQKRIEAEIENESKEKTPDFPLWVLPPLYQKYITDIAILHNTYADYPAMGLLAVVATLCGKREIEIESHEWKTKAILYFAAIGKPGSGKSPAIDKTMKTIEIAEDSLSEENNRIQENYENDLAQYEIDLQNWKRSTKSGMACVRPKKPEQPDYKTIITTDTTTEQLAIILSANDAIMIFKDELTGWITSMDQYRNGKGADRQFFLSSWNGSLVKVDRKKQRPIIAKNPHITICGGIVPENLNLLNKGNTNDGFFDRLLIVFPGVKKEPKFDTKMVDKATKDEVMRNLLDIWTKSPNADIVRLDDAAERKFAEYYDSCSDEDYTFISKMPQQCLRLALVLSVLYDSSVCTEEIMSKAIALSAYFAMHHKAAKGKSRESNEVKEQNAIIAWAKKHDLKKIRARHLQRARLPGCGSAKESKEKMKELVDLELATWLQENIEIELI